MIQRSEDPEGSESREIRTFAFEYADPNEALSIIRQFLDIPPEQAIRWITKNPAKSMGILDQTGTLEPGKMADVVVWSGNPFSVYTKADLVYVVGALAWDRSSPDTNPVTDFSLGTAVQTGGAE